MTLQELPKTAAETTLKLVKLPVDLVTKAREAVEKQLGGSNGADASAPVAEPTTAKSPKPKATPKKAAAKKPAVKKKPAAKKATAKKPTAKKATRPRAASPPTPADTVPAAERAAVIDEQTDGLGNAVDRAQSELHKRDRS